MDSQVPPPVAVLPGPPTLENPVGVLDAFVDGARTFFRQPVALFAAGLVTCLFCGLMVALSFVPFAVLLTAPILLLVGVPLATGLVVLSLRIRTGEKIRVRDIWSVGRTARKRLAGTFLTLTFLSLPCIGMGIALLYLGVERGSEIGDMTPGVGALLAIGILSTVLLGLLPWAYGGFAPSLVAGRGLGVWEALQLSRRHTAQQPVRSLLFALACLIVLAAGFLMGGVGLLVAAPWVCATRARMHESLFGIPHAPAG